MNSSTKKTKITSEKDSSVSLVKRQQNDNLIVLYEHNKIVPQDVLAKQMIEFQQGTIQLQVQVHKIPQIKRQFETAQSFIIRPHYSLGTFLQRLQINYASSNNPSIYICTKIKRFPSNVYNIIEKNVDERQYNLCSNFMGTQYDLICDNKIIWSMVYDNSCSSNSISRKFEIYALKPNSNWQNIEGINEKSNLKILYQQNNQYFGHLIKFINLEPTYHQLYDYYSLKFNQRSILPDVNNSIVVNTNGSRMLQMCRKKTQEDIYQINKANEIPQLWCIAYAIASLDFKIGIQ